MYKIKLNTYSLSLLLVVKLGLAHAVIYNIDKSIKPGNDFFAHATGIGLDTGEIDGEGRTCRIDDNYEPYIIETVINRCTSPIVNAVAENLKKNTTAAFQQKLQKELKIIDAIKNKSDFLKHMASLKKIGVSIFWDIGIINDKSNTKFIPQIIPEYQLKGWLNENIRNPEINPQIINIIIGVFNDVGSPINKDLAEKILQVDRQVKDLGDLSWDNPEFIQFNSLIGENAPLKDYFMNLGLSPGVATVVSTRADYLQNVFNKIIDQKSSLNSLKAYAKFSYLLQYSLLMKSDRLMAISDFEQKELGQDEKKSKRQGKINSVILSDKNLRYTRLDHIFGHNDLLNLCFAGYIENNREKILAIFDNIKRAYINNINSSAWITGTGKVILSNMIQSMSIQIGNGRPNFDDTNIKIDLEDPIRNREQIEEAKYYYIINHFGKQLNPNGAGNPFSTVYTYSSGQNKLTLPINMLIPPYFDQYANDDAIDYGNMGTNIGKLIGLVIANNLSRGTMGPSLVKFGRFAEQSKDLAKRISIQNRIDASKAQDASESESDQKGKEIFEQSFKEYALSAHNYHKIANESEVSKDNIVRMDIMINLSYNIGLAAAYDAYKIFLKGGVGPEINKVTADQRFFYSFAMSHKANKCFWRLGENDKLIVNGSVRNLAEFYPAFDVTKGQTLYLDPAKRFNFWN